MSVFVSADMEFVHPVVSGLGCVPFSGSPQSYAVDMWRVGACGVPDMPAFDRASAISKSTL